jgi:hypothetical protein
VDVQIASMIEIEVEMDIDVLAAEGAGAIAEQIERLMEVEDLQKVGFTLQLPDSC